MKKCRYFWDCGFIGIWKKVSLKSMDITHSPVCMEVLLLSADSMLNYSNFKNLFRVLRSRIVLHLLGFVTKNRLLKKARDV